MDGYAVETGKVCSQVEFGFFRDLVGHFDANIAG
jgi:hypothetical protein